MLKLLLSFLCCTLLSGQLIAADSTASRKLDPKLTLLKQQVIQDILSASVNAAQTDSLSVKMMEDGSWGDIDYADKTRGGWPVNDHLVRLNNMAVLYKRPGTKETGDSKLAGKIIAGLNYWLKNDFICPNWWYPEIGVPKVLGPTMLLMEDQLTQAQLDAGIKILNRATIRMTGQNKVWLSGNVIYRSLLTGDTKQIEAAVSAIQNEVVVSQGEGIQPDFSFHQHGPQQQFGNYGASFAGDMLKWSMMFRNTPFQFEPGKTAIIRDYLLQGMRWIIWKDKMDISACGRQLFPNAQVGKAKDMKAVFSKMPLVDPGFTKQYVSGMNDFDGDKHFWRSDMTVHRRKDFYTSVKMSSNRVAGAESCNDENVQGYHLGDGATYFYQSGDEYTDIFPFWDWKMIPGTTTFHDAVPLPVLPCSGYNIPSDFVGGVSDGINGIATLAYNRDSLYAQKSWFFFDDAVICLGAGIHSDENKEVTTAINQSFLHGNVLVKQATAPTIMEAGTHDLARVSWILHDNWGYYFPGKTDVTLANRQQQGDWNKVVTRMPARSKSADLFTLWFKHATRPRAAQYAYYVFPHATAGDIESRASAFTVIENSAQLQGIENVRKGMTGLVFVQPGTATTKLVNKVTADQPCVLLITRKNAVLEVVVSDPTHRLSKIVVGIEGKRKSKTMAATYDAGMHTTLFTVDLPQGPDAGRSARFSME